MIILLGRHQCDLKSFVCANWKRKRILLCFLYFLLQTGTTNPGYGDIHQLVTTEPPNAVYAEPSASTNTPMAYDNQSINRKSDVYAELTDPGKCEEF